MTTKQQKKQQSPPTPPSSFSPTKSSTRLLDRLLDPRPRLSRLVLSAGLLVQQRILTEKMDVVKKKKKMEEGKKEKKEETS
jgi:hypothetical protein